VSAVATLKWRQLLALAITHLDNVGIPRSDWTWGGGTVLAVRHRHSLSRDIDIFLHDARYLEYLSPHLNDAIAEDVYHYVEQANHLRWFMTESGKSITLSRVR